MFGDEKEGFQANPKHVIFGFMPPMGSSESGEEERLAKADPKIATEFAHARLRNMHANARMQETAVMLRGLEEMRSALQLFSIADDDTGSSSRPPFQVSFFEENRGKLQNAYLRLTERYLNYCEHMLVQQLDIKVTNEIRKHPPAAEPEQPVKKTRKVKAV